ncbi:MULTISPECIES: hypothetical protein [Haloarcula]|uniref:Uncharacterized protein n=1 Tax=Haloarcula pellucida TaxID=1427151 RepID=A0A830GQG4_9EURY|nr:MULTISPECIES: hypothetical protein [Halomicroarcula]MBX0350269.1 hypothetical protein [Halomicroarcula pellucida]MDS0277629.1 hypothetical protein [Halomicroarcula sp. S1AR25-4]GGO01245.1 hypothetical protein GCM10009030_34710 [Halomicroarcula pellucida]
MVPSPSDADDSAAESAPAQRSDAELYRIVRLATEDAILGAIGTVLLSGVGVVLFLVGVSAFFGADGFGAMGLSVAIALGGLYLTAATLGVIPPARDWL